MMKLRAGLGRAGLHGFLFAAAALGLGGDVASQTQVAAQRSAAPKVGFATEGQDVADQTGAVRVRVQLSAISSQDTIVPIQVGGSAVLGRDYRADLRPAVIPAGQRSTDIIVTILDDGDREDSDTIELSVTPTGGSQGHGFFARHKIRVLNTQLGDPVQGLTLAQLQAFNRGEKVFARTWTPSMGLGPFYNATSCLSCHSKPVQGGAAALYRNFFLAVYQFGPTPLSQSTAIPPFVSAVVPAFGSGDDHATTTEFLLDGPRPPLPETVFGFPVLKTHRNAIPVFGVGLFENITDATIIGNTDPTDLNADGISGQVNTQLGGAVHGRLGMKAQSNNIELFTRAPLMNQLGITSNPFRGADGLVHLARSPMLQVAGDPNLPTIDHDPVPDPEISHQDLGDLIAYGRFLAPPVKKPFDAAALNGEALFDSIGCTGCHHPSIPSTKGPLGAYTDLVLHYMGADLVDNIKLGGPAYVISEFRTAPLWGIGAVGPYLHDGRAGTLTDAILFHAGEGLAARNAFDALSASDKNDVIAFLEHL